MMKRSLIALCLAVASSGAIAKDFYVPSTISPEGKAFLTESFSLEAKNTVVIPALADIDGWKNYQRKADEAMVDTNKAIMAMYKPVISEAVIADVPVLDIKPQNWKDNGKVLVYTHGGAYTAYSAESTLSSSVPVANDTQLRVISVDYTLAPHAKFDVVTDQVIAVLDGLTKQGYKMSDIAIYGDSAGGGLAAGTVLKMRDKGMALPAAVVLWSPWADITETGDTYHTLKDAEPVYRYDLLLKPSADAYSEVKDQKNPYVSPVYGDYTKPYPPTLIQAGTKELFLSNAVRLYQAIDSNGGEAKLDVYEGMWHVFQAFSYDIPESKLARKKMAAFLDDKLVIIDPD
ncbi:alpha/beta hydrolase [Photobacterium sanguinicancri]|uniref:alpha/beta hydrolase n=1 Tax=Photobacterium sanguinicancri TaxID=875932 RepID=UPI0026E47FCE|nr:alpha/beta hydrolase [Photobacterium sanguinicancri]MDO6500753.1 alpha/beta hydrolase [Photobacterium sanguinicancri]